LVMVCSMMAGCGTSTLATSKTMEAPRVIVAHPVIRSLVDEDEYNGWLEAFKTVEVRSRVRGHITKVHFYDGDIVEQGQALFDLDSAPFEAELKQAEAQARALQAEEAAARKTWERNKTLVQTNAVTQQDLEKSEAEMASYQAQVVAKQAEADRHRLDIRYAKITADLAGRIGKAELVEGNLVNAGGTDPVLTTIVSISPIYVDFNVDERAIQRYKQQGSREPADGKYWLIREHKIDFSFGLDTDRGFPRQGQLVFTDNKFTEGTGTILVRGIAPNSNDQLVPGSRVRVRIPVSEKYNAPVIPDTAVLSDQDRKYLLVLGKNNIVLRRDITPGRLLDDGMRVILPAADETTVANNQEWLQGWTDMWVITVGLQRARLNYPVQPLEAQGQPIDSTTIE
jgi:RND family efflux transporter MFP subunit